MALFRDRRVFPRWSFIDSRSLPRPRYAKEESSAESVPTPPETPSEAVSATEVDVWHESPPGTAPTARAPRPAEPQPQPQRAVLELAPVSWLEERRNWFARGDWPTEAPEEAVQLAATRPQRPYTPALHPGLPQASPAEVRARHGRGFSSLTRRHRRRRHSHGHELARTRTDIDLAALDVALDDAAAAIGVGLVDLVVWHTSTGLELASRGAAAPELASAWHAATRDVRAMLPHAELPDPGSYHLVGLEHRRLAVLLHVHPDLGACVTVDLGTVAVDTLLRTTLPRLRRDLAATSTEY